MNSQRLPWLDAARGFGIIAIVIGHSYLPGSTSPGAIGYLYSFHVPLFIFLSGLVFLPERYSFLTLFFTRLRTVIVPYFIWGSFSILVYLVMGSFAGQNLNRSTQNSVSDLVLALLWSNPSSGAMRWNTPLWFLTCLVVVQLMAWALWKLCDIAAISKAWGFAASVFLAVIGYTVAMPMNLPWSFERALFLLPFFTGAVLLREPLLNWKFTASRWIAFIGAMLGYLVMVLITGINGTVDYVSKVLENPILLAVAALSGIAATLLLAQVCVPIRFITKLGQRTLTTLVIHKFPVVAVQVVLAKVGWDLVGGAAGVAIAMMSVLGVCAGYFFHPLIARFAPGTIGLRRRVN